MTATATRLAAAVEDYLTWLHWIRASGGATAERSNCTPLANLLNAVGGLLRPKVFCVAELADQGAGHPDFGLYAKRQVQRGRPRPGQTPERGVVEVKSAAGDAWLTAESGQVSRYRERYRLVLATNLRDFVLVGEDAAGRPATLETFRLAGDSEAFGRRLESPRAFAREVGAGFGEYLCRALSHRARLAEPKDLAWLLASYARDALARVEAAGEAPSLAAVRAALEEALGVRFEGAKGARFFRSTLVQTLFYGVFAAWVLWARAAVPPAGPFDWRTAVWHLRAPVLRALFQQLSDPGRLQPLGLVEVLDWTAAALDRVDRPAFFARFREGEAVPYFYEPFLEAFDPALRRQLGVWYTPAEVVRYMVARVDRALRDDLGVADGLAAGHVYVLDPCCGTGAYLAEVLRRIAANLEGRGLGALAGARVKQAAAERVFGFEIMPAPFVVAHLQVGLTMQDLDAPLAGDGAERPGVFLTNALTGWEPRAAKPLPFPELEEERDRAERVKQETPVLVILGNPPYNGFAGMAVDEERALSEAYRATRRVRRPEGQGLNDLYVRFFRMAERRIAEKTGQGVVCFISNYSWLDGLSFTGMRERYLEAFDVVRVDCLNGDKYKTGKVAPDGSPDPSIFSTGGDPVGIQVGTAVTTLVRKAEHAPAAGVGFRHLWGQRKREELTRTAETEPGGLYDLVEPVLPLGLPFAPTAVSREWFDWPALPDLFPVSFPGVQTKRDAFLIDIDLDRLSQRIADYFNVDLSHEEIARRYPSAMRSSSGFAVRDARAVRDGLLARGGPVSDGFLRFVYRPFDIRWIYWETGRGLLGRPSPDYRMHTFDENLLIEARERETKEDFSRGTLVRGLADNFGNGFSSFFPLRLGDGQIEINTTASTIIPKRAPLSTLRAVSEATTTDLPRDRIAPAAHVHTARRIGSDDDGPRHRPNLSATARHYLQRLGASVEDLFYHALAVLHDPAYREANAGALRMEWPRIPLPGWPDGDSGGAAAAHRTSPPAPRRPNGDSEGATAARAESAARMRTRPTAAGRADGRAAFDATARPGGAAAALAESAARGRELVRLLDPDAPVDGVTTGTLRPEIAAVARPATLDDRNMAGDDFALTAGWGHHGAGDAVMPGQGRTVERPFTADERAALGDALPALGTATFDVHLNDRAFWANVPAAVWSYRLGGYQVLKKWLSYRERSVLGRPLHPDEVQHFTDTARRIAAILRATGVGTVVQGVR